MDRTLVVAVDNRYDPVRQPLMEAWYDFYGYGGIVREESLGWGYSDEQWRRPAFLEANVAQTRAMVANSYNHGSV